MGGPQISTPVKPWETSKNADGALGGRTKIEDESPHEDTPLPSTSSSTRANDHISSYANGIAPYGMPVTNGAYSSGGYSPYAVGGGYGNGFYGGYGNGGFGGGFYGQGGLLNRFNSLNGGPGTQLSDNNFGWLVAFNQMVGAAGQITELLGMNADALNFCFGSFVHLIERFAAMFSSILVMIAPRPVFPPGHPRHGTFQSIDSSFTCLSRRATTYCGG